MQSLTTVTMNPTRERLFPPLYNNVEKRQEFQTNSRPPRSGFKGDTFAASSHCATHAAVNEQKYRADLVEGNRDLQLHLVPNQSFSRRHGSLISDCSHRRECSRVIRKEVRCIFIVLKDCLLSSRVTNCRVLCTILTAVNFASHCIICQMLK